MKFRRNLLFFPALFIGIVVLIIAVLSRQALPLKPSVSKSRPVDVLQLKKEDIAPVVIGFGRVEPKLIWQAIAQVSGKVVYRNRCLEKGQILPAGTLLLRIDPIDYQLAVAKAQANVTAKAAALDKLFLDEKNIKDTLEIETHRLPLSEDEFARKKKLNQKGLTSKSEVDDEQQAFLSQKMRVLDLENQRLLLPDEKKIIQAELKTSQLVFA